MSSGVLVIEEAPDGQVTHFWRPLRDFDLTVYPGQVIVIAGVTFIAIVGASGGAALVFVPVVMVASSDCPSGFELTLETP